MPDAAPGGETEIRHILIDMGNAKSSKEGGEGHEDVVFAPVVKDIVPDMSHFYAQYATIRPWIQTQSIS